MVINLCTEENILYFFTVKFLLDQHSHSTLAYLQSSNAQQNHFGETVATWEQKFVNFRHALTILGIQFSDVMRLLAAVLLLGNIEFDDSNSIGGELDVNGQNGSFNFHIYSLQ